MLKKKKEYREEIKKSKDRNKELKLKLTTCKDSKSFWEIINKFKIRKTNTNEIEESKWKQYLLKIYPEKNSPKTNIFHVRHPMLDNEICYDEIELVLKKAKNKKAPGCDELSYEFYKNLPDQGKKHLVDILNKAFISEDVPEEWATAVMQMLFKKGDREDPANYRGIALLNTITKIFTSVLQNRIYDWAEKLDIIDEGQAGFRQGRSCTDNLFTLYSALCINMKEKKSKVFVCFVDFRRCFDSICHELLWKHLHTIGLTGHVIRTIRSLYEKARVKIRDMTESVKLTVGLMQGDGLSPLLFLLFISDLTEFLQKNGVEGIRLNSTTRLTALMYADDLCLLANSEVSLQKMLNLFYVYCEKKITGSKCGKD